MNIRNAHKNDAKDIAAIYNHYIANTVATFELDLVSSQIIKERIETCFKQKLSWLVLENEGQIVAYCYASQWKARAAYDKSVEVTVYVAPDHQGNGYATKLYQALFKQLKAQGIHTALAVITLPNEGSTKLHENFAMEKVGHVKQVGFKFDQWLDVGYWQIIL